MWNDAVANNFLKNWLYSTISWDYLVRLRTARDTQAPNLPITANYSAGVRYCPDHNLESNGINIVEKYLSVHPLVPFLPRAVFQLIPYCTTVLRINDCWLSTETKWCSYVIKISECSSPYCGLPNVPIIHSWTDVFKASVATASQIWCLLCLNGPRVWLISCLKKWILQFNKFSTITNNTDTLERIRRANVHIVLNIYIYMHIVFSCVFENIIGRCLNIKQAVL